MEFHISVCQTEPLPLHPSVVTSWPRSPGHQPAPNVATQPPAVCSRAFLEGSHAMPLPWCSPSTGNAKDHHQPRIATNNRKPQTTTIHHRPLPPTTDHHQQPQTVTTNHGPSPSIMDHHHQPWTTSTNHRPPPTTTDHHHPSWTTITTNHGLSPPVTDDHHQS